MDLIRSLVKRFCRYMGQDESRAEESRAEESRAEESRAEESRAEESRTEESRADENYRSQLNSYTDSHRSLNSDLNRTIVSASLVFLGGCCIFCPYYLEISIVLWIGLWIVFFIGFYSHFLYLD